jgi:hypothetical protein
MKQFSRRYLLFVALCLSSSLFGTSKFGLWQDIYLEKPYGSWLVQFNQEAIFNNRGKHLFYEYNDIGCWYTGITTWFHVGAFYRYFMYEPTPNKQFVGEHGPHLDARIRTKQGHIFYQHRLRIQYLSGPITKKEWLMRNEFLVSINTRYLEFFGGIEPFYNFTTNKLPVNYLFAGIGRQFGKHFNAKVYYRNEQFPHRTTDRVHHYLSGLITLSF